MTHRADRLAAQLSNALSPILTEALSWLWPPLLRLLAQGHPVTTEELAAATNRTTDEVRRALITLPDAEYDEMDRVVGYGLTQCPTQHHFTVEDRRLYTWCALDTLLFPAVLGQAADVESPCHTTATPVRVRVEPDGVADVDPATAVVSLVTPQECTSVRSAFCNQVHFFVSLEAAQPWLAEHPEATVLGVADAFTLAGQLTYRHMSAPR